MNADPNDAMDVKRCVEVAPIGTADGDKGVNIGIEPKVAGMMLIRSRVHPAALVTCDVQSTAVGV